MYRLAIFVIFALIAACKFDAGVPPVDGTNAVDGSRDLGIRDTTSVSDSAPDVTSRDMPTDIVTQNDMTISDLSQDVGADMPNPLCNGVIRDLQNDPDHCGRCDNQCDTLFGSCSAGECSCPGGTMPCGPNNRCTELELDPTNCGMCGTTCQTAEWCLAGTCTCREGYKLCGGECVDIRSNPNHCGDCNVACNQNACQDGQCRNSASCRFQWTCDQPNTGPACIGDNSEWHCDPGFGNQCGDQCAGNEVCYDPGLGSPRECYAYRPAIVCTSCPCDECGADETCIVSDVSVGEIFCLEE